MRCAERRTAAHWAARRAAPALGLLTDGPLPIQSLDAQSCRPAGSGAGTSAWRRLLDQSVSPGRSSASRVEYCTLASRAQAYIADGALHTESGTTDAKDYRRSTSHYLHPPRSADTYRHTHTFIGPLAAGQAEEVSLIEVVVRLLAQYYGQSYRCGYLGLSAVGKDTWDTSSILDDALFQHAQARSVCSRWCLP